MTSVLVVLGGTVYLIFFCHRHRHLFSTMLGMMVAMCVTMMVSLFVGCVAGIITGSMFISNFFAVWVGMIVGFSLGKPISLWAVLEGVLAGIMGGMMGAMLGVMVLHEWPAFVVGMMALIFLLTMTLLLYLIAEETGKKGRIAWFYIFFGLILCSMVAQYYDFPVRVELPQHYHQHG